MGFLSTYLRPYWKMLIAVLILAAINQIFSLLNPQILRWLMDNYLVKAATGGFTTNQYVTGVLRGLGGMIGTAMVSRVAKNFQDYFVNVMTQKIGTSIYQDTIAHTFSLPYAVFEDQQSGQLLSKLVKAKESIQLYIASLINVVFFALVGVAFVLVYAATVDWRVTAMYGLLIPLMALTTIGLSKRIKKAQMAISAQSNTVAGSITESIRNVSLIKMLGLVGQETKRLDKANQEILGLELKKVKTVRSIEFIQGTIINAMSTSIIGLLAYLVYDGGITVGELMSLYFYSFFVFGQLSQFGQVIKNYQEAKANHEIIQDIMKQQPEAPDEHLKVIEHVNSLKLQDVSFSYNADKEIISDFSAQRSSGQTIAFVGPSGSGKSTILKLICGLYLPTHGTIAINDIPTTDINLTALKHKIGIVSQDAQLFSGTIRENLLFVAPEATDDDIRLVLKQASLESYIAELELGLDTMIGEGGVKLSGGQRQRLAIARALLRNPQILIFDEATSALDSLVEKEIADTIQSISQSRPDLMTVIVAHRLSTVMHADSIYVLEHGKIIEQGHHDHLLTLHGLYAAMWRQQIGE
ncbi:Putative multidrug export ATP-binding/permease protein [candidate division SR1 bacterium Aalborg_AAW-1]|nr:Putative multidrug export ATP-binding/permease protein [candidate division SR1 bacterium Aalborg_AAW-1]